MSKFDNKRVMPRYSAIAIVMTVFALCIVGKSIYIATAKRDYWMKVAQRQKKDSVTVKPTRGNILSCDGQLMASSLPEYKLFMDFKALKEAGNDSLWDVKEDSICMGLSKIFPELTFTEFKRHIDEGRKKQSRHWSLYPRRINYNTFTEVKALPVFNLGKNSSGFHWEEYNARTRGFGGLAGRTIGALFGAKDTARFGLELSYDSILRGTNGIVQRKKVLNKYLMTDTLGNLVPQTDTLQILSKQPYEKRLKEAQKSFEEWKKKEEKKRKRGEPYDSIMPPKELNFKLQLDSKLDPDRNIRFEFDTPLASADTSKIHLYAKHDTLWYEAPLRFEPIKTKMWGDSIATEESKRIYTLRAEWRPDIEYSLEIDSLAFTDIYGVASAKLKKGFKVGSLDDYSSVVLNIQQLKGKNICVELLSREDKAVKSVQTTNGYATFYYIKPGIYYARLFVDTNNNGVWDTGDYNTGLQPEEVFYYPYNIECKAKWDMNLNWDITAKPLDQQKPNEIKKQKGEQQRKIQQRNIERARKMGIAYPF